MTGKGKKIFSLLGPVLAISAAIVYLLCISWGKWGSLLIDTFHEPGAAWQINTGRVLYRDIFYEYGVLPPYILALLVKIFGLSLKPFIFFGTVIFVATTALVYKISRVFLGRASALLPAIFFAVVFAVREYYPEDIFNYILPYSFASTLFCLAILAALLFFLYAVEKEKKQFLYCWAAAMYAAFLCRVEMSFLLWAGFFVLNRIVFSGQSRKTTALLFLPAAAATLTYVLFLQAVNGWEGFYESNIKLVQTMVSNNAYHAFHSGTMLWQSSSLAAGKNFLLYLVLMAALAVCAALWDKGYKGKSIGIISAVGAFFVGTQCLRDIMLYFGWPVVLLLGAGLSAAGIKKGSPSRPAACRLILFVTGFLMTARTFLAATPLGLNFCFGSVAIIAFYVFYLQMVKDFLQKRINGFSPKIFVGLSAALFLWLNSFMLAGIYKNYQARSIQVNTPQGTVFCRPSRTTESFWQLVAYLKKNSAKTAKVGVLPEGCGINFFTSRINPMSQCSLTPPVFDLLGDDRIIDGLAGVLPEYIVIVSRQTPEYGKARFGIDYGQKTDAWIKQKYRLEKVFGAYPFASSEPGMALWQRIEKHGE